MTAEIVFAAILLTTPPPGEPISERLPTPVPDAWLVALRPSLVAMSVNAEAVDEREIPNSIFAIHELQERYQSLKDAPRLVEAERFPGPDWIAQAMSLNRAVRAAADARRAIDLIHAEDLAAIVSECDCTYSLLNELRTATSPYVYLGPRRQALAALRDRLGPAAFLTGQLPPCVPIDLAEAIPVLRRRLP